MSAALTLVVAGLGPYSIMAHAMAWRRPEIGVRLALGARPAAYSVHCGALIAPRGIALALFLAIAARSWIEPVLFNPSGTDSNVFGTVAGMVETLAC